MEEKERPFAVRAEASERARLGNSSERATTSVQVSRYSPSTNRHIFLSDFSTPKNVKSPVYGTVIRSTINGTQGKIIRVPNSLIEVDNVMKCEVLQCLKTMVTSAREALATPITSKPSIAASALVLAAVVDIDRPITTVAAVEIMDVWKLSVS